MEACMFIKLGYKILDSFCCTFNFINLLLQALSDSLQQERLKFVIDGDQSLKIDGLLTLVKNNQVS